MKPTFRQVKIMWLATMQVVSRLWGTVPPYQSQRRHHHQRSGQCRWRRRAPMLLICYANLYKGTCLIAVGCPFTGSERTHNHRSKCDIFSTQRCDDRGSLNCFEAGATAATTAKFDTRFQKEIDFTQAFQAMLARTYVMLGDYDKGPHSCRQGWPY